MEADHPFLGTGWSFPPEFDNARGEVEMSSGVEDIYESLEVIFTTALGERLMQPRFGCNMEEYVQEPMNTARRTYLQNLLKTAILYHEPRIDAKRIDVAYTQMQGRLDISIEFEVRGTNSRFNFVFPFYVDPVTAA